MASVREGVVGTWAVRFMALLMLLWAVAIPLLWIAAGYLELPVTQVLSFHAADGWCDPATQGLGVHCFGDYYFPASLLDRESVWEVRDAFPHGYTPTGMLPQVVGTWLTAVTGIARLGLVVYLAAIAVALLVPAWLAARGTASRITVFVVLGVISQPFLIAMDRGNSVALAIPAIAWFAYATSRQLWWQAAGAVVVASLVRPQLAFIAMALVAARRWREFGSAAAGSLALLVLGFLLWPGSRVDNVTGWLDNIGSYDATQPVERNVPTNLSAAHAVTVVTRWLQNLPSPLSDAARSVQDLVEAHPAWPGYALLLIVLVVLAWRGRSLPGYLVLVPSVMLPVLVPGVSFSYYLIIPMVIAAALVVSPDRWRLRGPVPAGAGWLDDDARDDGSRWWPDTVFKAGLVAATALSMVPLAFPLAPGENSVVAQNLGLLWSAVVVWGLLVAVLRRRTSGVATADRLD